MPRLPSVAFDDLQVGDVITVFCARPSHCYRGSFVDLSKHMGRYWLWMQEKERLCVRMISTRRIERIERHRKAVRG